MAAGESAPIRKRRRKDRRVGLIFPKDTVGFWVVPIRRKKKAGTDESVPALVLAGCPDKIVRVHRS
jgi:hypothetical protein